MLPRLRQCLVIALGVLGLLAGLAAPAWAAQSITLTWVRHAQSTDNANGIISATVPGAGLTALGETQAQAVAEAIAPNAYDGIYVSDMIRTQQTAAPLAAELGITPVVIGGVREIASGILTGLPGTTGILYTLTGLLYAIPPAAWSLGARFVPGIFGEDGNMFNDRTSEAIADVYASGDTNPVVFSHGGTIQAWTLMNVTNPVLTLPPLSNTDVVVVAGNPEDGWTLQSWAGRPVSQNPDLLTKLFVDLRAWLVAPQTAIYTIGQSLLYSNWFTDGSALTALVDAVGAGIVSVATATVQFVQAVIRDVGGAFTPMPPSRPGAVLAAPSGLSAVLAAPAAAGPTSPVSASARADRRGAAAERPAVTARGARPTATHAGPARTAAPAAATATHAVEPGDGPSSPQTSSGRGKASAATDAASRRAAA